MVYSVSASEIADRVSDLVRRANMVLPQDVFSAIKAAKEKDSSETASTILGILIKNAAISLRQGIPICQDTGIDVVFVELGQELVVQGDLYEAINQGVARGTKEGFLRASVCDPVTRKNSGDNTPAVVHVTLTKGSNLRITILPKGCGSENMSRLRMLPPSAGMDGVMDFVVECVRKAGPNPCPPGIIGVGIGGTMEMASLLAKRALLRPVGKESSSMELARLEQRLLERINGLGIGPQGLGGKTTTLWVALEKYPCHIASLPVAVNIQCHAARKATALFEKGKWKIQGQSGMYFEDDFLDASGLLEKAIPLNLPLIKEEVRSLKAGQWVRLSGRLLTGRDQTHSRLCEIIKSGASLPVDLKGQLIYYVGPSPAPPGHVVGAAGPTTSYRMDAYTPAILEQGVLGLMGKGKRSLEVRKSISEHGAVYLATIGGAGAYLSQAIKEARVVAFEDIGPEALYEFYVEDFPAIVINDCQGHDYYEMVQGGAED